MTPSKRLSKYDLSEIKKLLDAGHPVREVAAEFGVTPSSIYRRISRPEPDHLQELSILFDKIHEQLFLIKEHTRSLEDPEATELADELEKGALKRIRRLRLALKVSYT
jgi:IS30 family transposase